VFKPVINPILLSRSCHTLVTPARPDYILTFSILLQHPLR
jgi:hypothetical protein